ncbi:hypothetical protein [Achromobacter marplatensis]|uniref:Uncharacterized protein n=1 Tax=Achromobacter marplatensis TaxID=470868 RepID=A0AA42WGC9_9BURK|nr:hypothetical protein [Achromobacter marplatensis]MDH2053377.1 hypothetical protein [Achromobacter marplatensis]
MNAITATALETRRRKLPSIAHQARKLGDLIAPRDHAGKGNWSKDADIPPWIGWPAGIALSVFVLFGRQILGWAIQLVA